MNYRALAALLITSTLASHASAQDLSLNLAQVLESVREHHPVIERARLSVREAEGDRLAAEGAFDLNLRARATATPFGYYDWGRADIGLSQQTPLWGASLYAGWRIGRGGDIPDYYGNYRTLDAGELRAGLRVPLWRDGPIDSGRAGMRRGELGVEASEAALEARSFSLRLAATRSYWTWVAAGLKASIARQLLELAEERNGQIRARVAAGALAPIEALENRRVIARRRSSNVAARRALERATINLSLYLRDGDGRPRLASSEELPATLSIVGDEPPSDESIEEAMARRPDLRRYEVLVERQEVAVELAENQVAPRIDLNVGASIDLGTGSMMDQTRLGPAVVEGGITISMPLQFRRARGRAEAARAELSSARAARRYSREQARTELQNALSAWRAAAERAQLAQEAADLARQVADAERERFELGMTQLFIVNLREQAAAGAAAEAVDARARLRAAVAQWRAVAAIN